MKMYPMKMLMKKMRWILTDLLAPKLGNFKEAIQSLDDVQEFLESRGYIEEALKIGSAVDTLTTLKLKSSQQTTLHNYFVRHVWCTLHCINLLCSVAQLNKIMGGLNKAYISGITIEKAKPPR